jgi:hypothetical protein
MMKSRRKRWAGHVACIGRGEVFRWLWWENPREREKLKDLGIDRK